MILFAGSTSRCGLLVGPVGCFYSKATVSRRRQLLCTEGLLCGGAYRLSYRSWSGMFFPKLRGKLLS